MGGAARWGRWWRRTGRPAGAQPPPATDPPAPARPRVRLLGKPGCHLCDDARAVVAAVCAELGEQWEEVDVTTDPALHAQYAEEIPVTLVDGRQHDFWRVDPARLRAALRA